MKIGKLRYDLEDFAKLDPLEVFEDQYNWFYVTDEYHETVVLNGREAIITIYGYHFFERLGLEPILGCNAKDLSIDAKSINAYNTMLLTSATSRRGSYETDVPNEDVWDIFKSLYRFINDIYNLYVSRLQPHIGTISGFDLIDLFDDDVISEIRSELNHNSTTEEIEEAYVKVRHEVMQDRFKKNNVRHLIDTKALDHKVTDQIIVSRGKVPDIDSSVFPVTVSDSFGGGLTKTIFSFLESRLGAMSALYQTNPLRTTEYGNRRHQLNGAYFHTIRYHEDCGSQRYHRVVLTEDNAAMYAGKRIIDQEGNKEILTHVNMKNYIGDEIGYRSIEDCKIPQSGVVCEFCYGVLARHLPPHVIVGHYIAAIFFQIISQLVLSVKHVLGSASYSIFEPDEKTLEGNMMTVNAKELRIRLKKHEEFAVKGIVIDARRAHGLSALDKASDLTSISTQNTSALKDLVFRVDDGEVVDDIRLNVSSKDSVSHLSKDFLAYIKKNNWVKMENGDVYVSLEKWDYSLPIFEIPMRNPNMLDFFNHVDAVLSNTVSRTSNRSSKAAIKTKGITSCETYQEAVHLFIDTLATRNIQINIAMVESIIKPFTYRGADDWRVGMAGNFNVANYDTLIANRSWTTFQALEGSSRRLSKASTYIPRKTPYHYMDEFID